MESNKVILNIRPNQSKNKFTMLRIQKIRFTEQEEVEKVRTWKFNSDKNIRSDHKEAKAKTEMVQQIQNRHISVNEKKNKKKEEKQYQLPEIYNPKPTISMKYLSTGKFTTKYRRSTAESMIENKKQSKEDEKRSQSKDHHKTEMTQKNKNFKIKQMETPKEMSKEKKIEMFKVIRNQFNELINATNNMSVRNPSNHFRAYIQKGNNGILVKEILKKRWWWHLEDDPSKANLLWTEWYNKEMTAHLPILSIYDETIEFEEYRNKKSEEKSNSCTKSEAIKKIVDQQTFKKLTNSINLMTNNYFKKSKQSTGCVSLRDEQVRHTVAENQTMHNHVEGCLNLHSKKLLFMNFKRFMAQKQWDPFQFIPLTFYIEAHDSQAFDDLLAKHDQISHNDPSSKNIWIIKPGENSNRGNGIKVVASRQDLIHDIKRRLPKNGSSKRTAIVQKYMQKCFLINNRKFDIRCYLLITTANGVFKGYWYKEGYIRTSSSEYNLDNVDDEMVHLTNDAVQKKGNLFGKHEDNNKMSFEEFKQYLRKNAIEDIKFQQTYEQMKLIAYYLLASVATKIKRKQFTFELFGLDYMLDSEMKPYLIEANSNPCLENKGKILGKLIHELVENVAMTAIDPIFPPPSQRQGSKMKDMINKDYFETNKFQLIFNGKASQ